ncbi:MAG: hypothetical protein FJ104_17530, partial [Deltaproteobacteria bacterium]|nr:hypothetical protein [Deltaproteobacteria bacterium]
QYCRSGACTTCSSGTANCDSNAADCETNLSAEGTCGTGCADRVACVSGQLCIAGACVAPPSCQDLPSSCGPAGDESCCASPRVTGGTYNRVNDATYPATVSDFRLDRFEVTVGRFRRFVAAVVGGGGARQRGPAGTLTCTGGVAS